MMKWIRRVLHMNRTSKDTVAICETTDAKKAFHIELKLKKFGIPFEVEIRKSPIGNNRREYKVKVLKQDVERTRKLLD